MKKIPNIDYEKKAYLECECESEGILAEVRQEFTMDEKMKPYFDIELWLSFFDKGHFGTKHSFKSRLRFIWHTLKTGFPFADMVILDKAKAKELVDFIQKNFLDVPETLPFIEEPDDSKVEEKEGE